MSRTVRAFAPPAGFRLIPEALSASAQASLLSDVLAGVAAAPFYRPAMPRTGAPLSVQMTNFGPLGWLSDVSGYRYGPHHPVTGRPWPPIPPALLKLWDAVSACPAPPEACLVNWYDAEARLGLHIDADEDAKDAAVVSVSLGDAAKFRLGGLARTDPTRSFTLRSGDVVVLGDAARRAYHGVDRILPGTSRLVPFGGRINLTLRRVRAVGPPDVSAPLAARSALTEP